MPPKCNRGFYCRSYCLLNMFRAPLCPSSGAQEYYTVVAACGISYCGFQVAGLVWSWGLCVRFAGCCSLGFFLIVKTILCTPRGHLKEWRYSSTHSKPRGSTEMISFTPRPPYPRYPQYGTPGNMFYYRSVMCHYDLNSCVLCRGK